ncbi:putative ribonuclease H-like domain-containing protein [Tanacetum coccineum]
MEAGSSTMVTAAKLPVLNPGEFELWKMRIEQTVDGVEQTYHPTTTNEKLTRKNELKARGKGSSSSNQNLQNVAFVSSNNSGSSNQAYGSNSASTDSMSDAINADDLEEMDLKWQMAILTMRARRFLNKSGRKINANGSETIWFTKSKVECYNCHKKGHFARECRAPREHRNRELVKRNATVETTKTKALVALDRLGYDWSDQAEEGPTNCALMAYTSSGSSSSSSSDFEVSTCSKACLKSYETLKEHYDNLTKDINKSQLNIGAYKAGLESIEARIDVYKKNEVIFEEVIKILKLDIKLRDNALTELRKKFEKAEKERDDLKLTLEKFGNSSKNPSKLLEIQVSDKFKTGVGFDSQVVDSQVFDSQENDRYKISKGYHAIPPPYTGNFMPPKYDLVLVDEEEYVLNWISDNEDENENEFKSKHRKPSFARIEFVKSNKHVKTPRESVKKVENKKQAEYPRKNSQSPRVNSAKTTSNVLNRAHSHFRMPFNNSTTNKNSNLKEKVNTVKGNVTTAGQKAVVSDNKGNEANAVKTSTSRITGKEVIDSGRSRHMTGNKPYLSDYEEIDGGFVAFGGDPKGGRITGKGKISTCKLDFEDVYFVKDLKFNLFSVSQMCDKKNSVLFTDTECVVLSPDFKLLNENHVLLSVDLKNIVHSEGHLGKFDGKADEGFFVGYSTNSKAYRVFNSRTRIVEENLYVKFSEETPNIARNRPNWLFDIDALTISMNYKPVDAGNQTNGNTSTKENIDAGQAGKKIVPDQEYILLPLLTSVPSLSKSLKDSSNAGFKPSGEEEKIDSEHLENKDSKVPNIKELRVHQEQDVNVNNTNNINTICLNVNVADIENNDVDENIVRGCIDDPTMPNLEDIVYSDYDEEVGAEDNMNNLATTMLVSPIPNTRVHKDHSLEQIIGDIHSAPQTRRMTKNVTDHVEPKNVIQALTDPRWIEAMQDELLQFKLQKVWTLVELPYGKSAIGTKWMYKNKKDDRGIVIRNKARLVAQGYTEEKGIDYDEVFAPVARIEAIRIFLAYASFMNFIVYQMDVKSSFLFGIIEEEVYVCQLLGFEDPEFPNKVYKIEKALYGLHQVPRACQDKYVADILKKFNFATVKIASTPIETNKASLKDEEVADVDVHLYRSMIGSLMYLTASRPDIMFVVCACARFQVTPKTSHLHAVKRIFRYLKGHPKLGLWKATIGGCQFLRKWLISWQCKKQTIVANSTTKAEYVAVANCCGQMRLSLKREDKMERAATTASSLEAEQDSGNINRTQSMATLNESFLQETDSTGGPRCQDTIFGV